MNRDDWICVGLKLIGVYLGVQGVVTLISYGIYVIEEYARRMAMTDPFNDYFLPINLFRMSTPVVYFLLAYLLTHRTQWCLEFVTPQLDTESQTSLEEQ
jgi:hypothetical protein